MDWVYKQIIGFLANFFAEMGNMGAEMFEMSWVQSIVLFARRQRQMCIRDRCRASSCFSRILLGFYMRSASWLPARNADWSIRPEELM